MLCQPNGTSNVLMYMQARPEFFRHIIQQHSVVKASIFIRKTVKILIIIAVVPILFVTGAVLALYSPWMQELSRSKAVEYLNSMPGVQFSLDSFRLRFPLQVELGGLCYAADGDTLVAASKLHADVSMLPLLQGVAEINSVSAEDARYNMGAPDSAMYMRIKAERLDLSPSSVSLADMNINLSRGDIYGGCLDLTLNPDTTATNEKASEPTTMVINAGKLNLNDFTFRMRMLPVIDSLGAHIADAAVSNAVIDLKRQTINIDSFEGSRLGASYIAPDSATIAATPQTGESSDSTAAPWTIKIAAIDFTESNALYTTRGVTPQPGLDFAYIQADSMHLHVSDFYNRASEINLPLTLSAHERCGIALRAKGTFAIADSVMSFDNFVIRTAETTLSANGFLGLGDMTSDPRLPMGLQAEGDISNSDLRMMFPFLSAYLYGLPRNGHLGLELDVNGTLSLLDLKRLYLRSNGVIQLQAKGTLSNIFSPYRLGVNLNLSGNIQRARGLMGAFLPAEIVKQYNIPPMTLGGHVRMNGQNYDARLNAHTMGGALALDGYLRGRAEAYSVDLSLRDMPVNAFAPALGIGRVSGSLAAKGHGFDFFSPSTAADVTLRIDSAMYRNASYRGIDATVRLAEGKADVKLDSSSDDLDLHLAADGNLSGDTYEWNATLNGTNIDLYALNLSETESSIKVAMAADASYTPSTNTIGVNLKLNSLDYNSGQSNMSISNVTAHLNSTDSVTNLSMQNRDFYAFFSSECGLDSLISSLSATSLEMLQQEKDRRIDISRLQKVLPPFVLDINAGRDNMLTDILHDSDMDFRRLTLEAANDSLLSIDSRILDFRTGSTRLDTIKFKADQHADSMLFGAYIGNRPGTLDAWKQVQVKGSVAENRAQVLIDQHNARRQQGFYIGMAAELHPDSTLIARLTPLDPIIGYQQWQVNADNFISYNLPTRHIDANLHMNGGNSSLAIYTEHDSSLHSHDSGQEDLIIKVGDIHIQDWIAINPFAPQMSGDLNADMRLSLVDKQINAKGTVGLNEFFYDRRRVGTILADVDVSTRPGGVLYANTDVSIDGVKTMTLSGNLNDMTTGSPYNLNFSMIRFPLTAVNPFLPADVATLRGVLNGNMDIKGDADNPIVNGTLDFDSTAVKLAMTGVEYKFSETKIPMENNVVRFNDFAISGVNENPLRINGSVNIKELTSPLIDLKFKANDMMLINNNRAAKGADIYGKALINIDANVKGSMQWLNVNADLNIRPGTNVTYVMSDATSAIQSQGTGEMVTFVNFTDSAAMAMADSVQQSAMNLALRANLFISSGSTINVDLSTNGSNKVSVQPQADLDFVMSPLSGMRLTGRFNIEQGFVRYTPPLMSEKYFTFNDGSYIAFNGEVMNPTLNIHATDILKANVTQEGQNSRLVNFDVILNVTGTFNNMNVGFDLATRDDITVANELESMSAEQRANQAMNLLLYNVYTGPGTKANASLSGNPLFSFLESQLNSWAANNIRGIDISFGINQYDRTVDGSSSQTTSYSYQVSKSLFNDRFKIVVGGNYSTDANADENFSQNLINDISFLYYLNNSRSMYVRIFRHTGYESIIEGEVTETGVGFVYRRKLNRIADMFKFLRPKKRKPVPPTDIPVETPAPAESTTEVKPVSDEK